jgi:hypothetical protein
MECKQRLLCGNSILLVLLIVASSAKADFVELERLLETPAGSLAQKLGDVKVVVAVRNGVKGNKPWNIAEAAGVELTAALRRHGIDAIRAAGDTRLDKLEAADQPFTAERAKELPKAGRQVLVGVEWLASKKPRIKITAFAADAAEPLWSRTLAVPEQALSLEKNIPPLNRSVREFARKSLGTCVLEGDCTQLPRECLKAAGIGMRGVYRWGRELGLREPWLPGDILQMERTSVTMYKASRYNIHHSAVIDAVDHETVTVLHQNAFPKGKVVQRETWPLAGIKGYVAAYCPWDWPGSSPYPAGSPTRWTPVLAPSEPASESDGKKPRQIDLLHLVNPRVDRVQGIWFFEKNGRMRCPVEVEARLQIPVVPPQSYVLRMTMERLQGNECFGLGVVAGGHQTMIEIDGFQSRFTGLHDLDHKGGNGNDSTKRGKFLPLHKVVELECRVTANSIHLDIDRQEVLNWHGDPSRLSVSPDWPVPHGDWLFVAAYCSEFEIRSLTLEATK